MAINILIGGGNAAVRHKRDASKGDVDLCSVDFSAWAEDNGDVDAVTWETPDGGVAASGEALSDNVATATLSFGTAGRYRVKLTATAGTRALVVWLDVLVRGDCCDIADDYGFVGYGY